MGYKTTSIEVGTRFGRLRTTGPVELRRRADNRNRAWVPVICDCGQERTVMASNLFSGNTTSCGCYFMEVVSKGRPSDGTAPQEVPVTRIRNGKPQTFMRARTHGLSKTDPVYKVWAGMRYRCNSPAADNYKFYGGRGIKVCTEWGDFLVFREWAHANGYSLGLELDRMESDDDYRPGNCRWITKKANIRNRDLAWSDEVDAALIKRAQELGVSPYDIIRVAVEDCLGLS